jgi:hypothetical protein
MNLLKNYPEFRNDIIVAFSKIMSDYAFKLKEINDGEFELNNQRSVIFFSFDRGNVSCFIRPAEDEERKKYLLLGVYRFLFKKDLSIEYSLDPKTQLIYLANIISEYFGPIITGDFSWIGQYEEEQLNNRRLIRFIQDEIDKENPIYLKYLDNDPNWFVELKSYIEDNNITLL